MQRAFGGGVVGLAAVAGLSSHGGDGDDAAPARAQHGQHEGLGHVEKTVEVHVDHALPLRGAHAGKNGVVMRACVADEHLNGAARQRLLQRVGAGGGVGYVKSQGFGAAACGADTGGQRLGGVQARVGVGQHMQALCGQGAGDGAADGAAGAGDEGAAGCG